MRSIRPADTTPEAHMMLVARWRSMTVAGRVALVRQLCDDVDRLARAGIVVRDPRLTDADINRELVRRRYGRAVVDAAFADRP